ncbi:ras association domain-containing protein 8-like isoform X2 [Hypanus sabinus]|uniref:ras association domain-containing protein 8-like isoform X2 n=1 Tax=Hypanus sabinus TaxID=79690 RepID=UPI0028C4CF8C|nr:ras association domain-containing protein 8-like isoform X2 [Hypanus sabinus]
MLEELCRALSAWDLMPVSAGTLMELKVWVEGVQRVVCGVTEDTSCQQVVIALAQAIGQTGRYVLIQSFQGSERQLMPTECPVQLLTACGQSARDIQFILRRTGHTAPENPSPGLAHARPKKSLTFSGGAPEPSQREKWKSRGAKAGPPTKEDLVQLIQRQQRQLRELADRHSAFVPETASRRLPREQEEEAARGAEEDEEEGYWERELQAERWRERELLSRLEELKGKMKEVAENLLGTGHRAQLLGREITQEGERARAKQLAEQNSTRVAIGNVQAHIQSVDEENQQLQRSLLAMEQALEEAELRLQAKGLELEELNKELRQCNLQQFIQQTGSGGGHSRNEEGPHSPPTSVGELDFMTRPTSRHFLGNPRNLQNPVVSSLNPEGVFV